MVPPEQAGGAGDQDPSPGSSGASSSAEGLGGLAGHLGAVDLGGVANVQRQPARGEARPRPAGPSPLGPRWRGRTGAVARWIDPRGRDRRAVVPAGTTTTTSTCVPAGPTPTAAAAPTASQRLDALLDADGGDESVGRAYDVGQPALDPEATLVVEMADVAGAVPAPVPYGGTLGHPQGVVAVLDVGSAHADLPGLPGGTASGGRRRRTCSPAPRSARGRPRPRPEGARRRRRRRRRRPGSR